MNKTGVFGTFLPDKEYINETFAQYRYVTGSERKNTRSVAAKGMHVVSGNASQTLRSISKSFATQYNINGFQSIYSYASNYSFGNLSHAPIVPNIGEIPMNILWQELYDFAMEETENGFGPFSALFQNMIKLFCTSMIYRYVSINEQTKRLPPRPFVFPSHILPEYVMEMDMPNEYNGKEKQNVKNWIFSNGMYPLTTWSKGNSDSWSQWTTYTSNKLGDMSVKDIVKNLTLDTIENNSENRTAYVEKLEADWIRNNSSGYSVQSAFLGISATACPDFWFIKNASSLISTAFLVRRIVPAYARKAGDRKYMPVFNNPLDSEGMNDVNAITSITRFYNSMTEALKKGNSNGSNIDDIIALQNIFQLLSGINEKTTTKILDSCKNSETDRSNILKKSLMDYQNAVGLVSRSSSAQTFIFNDNEYEINLEDLDIF